MVTVEERLAALLRQAARGIDHADAIDDENRSEIYTIIQAMQSDTQEHCNIVGQWVSDRKQEPGNA